MPHELHFDGKTLFFHKQGKPLFKIATGSIDKTAFMQKEHLYGIGIWLKRPVEEKVKVLQERFNFVAYVEDSVRRFDGCDLFLPYFSEHSHRRLKDLLG